MAADFFRSIIEQVQSLTGLRPELLLIPGNHDLVIPEDTALRDVALASLKGEASTIRPKPSIEGVILSPLKDYFSFAIGLTPGSTLSEDRPYYFCEDKHLDGKLIRFHLINSAWMCARGQGAGELVFPVGEIRPAESAIPPDYEVTLLHHPFNWFRQPETMRPLREAVEGISDMILTGHEHVGRMQTTSVCEGGDYEYREGEALQDGVAASVCGFHVLRLDFQSERQTLTTYRWESREDAFLRPVGPAESSLGRNIHRAARANRLRSAFAAELENPELPVVHSKQGPLRLSDFYTYPDLGLMREDPNETQQRVRGGNVLALVEGSTRVLLLGPDRCGKTSLAKRLVAGLHARGMLPLLLQGSQLRNVRIDRINRVLDNFVKDQYEELHPEAFWQSAVEKRVLLLDDLHHLPSDRDQREELLVELEKKFGRVVLFAPDEFCFEEIFSGPAASGQPNPLWAYTPYRILPFGYMLCEQFVRNWVGLDRTQTPEARDEKVAQINGLLGQFLRTNPIPQHPWVVTVIVQQMDSPEPVHAKTGSYGYLLEALITATLSKSRNKLPLPGKYCWLGVLANEIYTRDLAAITDGNAREAHAKYCAEYGVEWLDYKEMRDDLIRAGVLRLDGDMVSFRQPYTYCYFVAYHLSRRIDAEDVAVGDSVRELCEQLHHEDAANVLVFLAHLTTRVVLEAMCSRADELFSRSSETDLVRDVGPINDLYVKVQSLVVRGDPAANLRELQDGSDTKTADRHRVAPPTRPVVLRPVAPDSEKVDNMRVVMDIAAAMRTIEILGQVLRNEATARKVDAMVEVADRIFRLGRRILGYLYKAAEDRLDQIIGGLEVHYRRQLPSGATEKDVADEVSQHLFNRYLFATFAVVKHVALAVSERNLKAVFQRLAEADENLANRIYNLAIDFELAGGHPPISKAETLHNELAGKIAGVGRKKAFNNLAQTLVPRIRIGL